LLYRLFTALQIRFKLIKLSLQSGESRLPCCLFAVQIS